MLLEARPPLSMHKAVSTCGQERAKCSRAAGEHRGKSRFAPLNPGGGDAADSRPPRQCAGQPESVCCFFLEELVSGETNICGLKGSKSLCFIYGYWSDAATDLTAQVGVQRKLYVTLGLWSDAALVGPFLSLSSLQRARRQRRQVFARAARLLASRGCSRGGLRGREREEVREGFAAERERSAEGRGACQCSCHDLPLSLLQQASSLLY